MFFCVCCVFLVVTRFLALPPLCGWVASVLWPGKEGLFVTLMILLFAYLSCFARRPGTLLRAAGRAFRGVLSWPLLSVLVFVCRQVLIIISFFGVMLLSMSNAHFFCVHMYVCTPYLFRRQNINLSRTPT